MPGETSPSCTASSIKLTGCAAGGLGCALPEGGAEPGYGEPVADDKPMDTAGTLYFFNEETLAYAGYYVHEGTAPLHCHSFVEIAFITGGHGVHQSRTGDQKVCIGDVILLRPGVWHGYDHCQSLTACNCCFSSELLRREFAWTRDDPMLGYLLWTGPYSDGHGILTIHLDADALRECGVHLAALTGLGYGPMAQYRADIVGRLSLLFSILGRAVAKTHRSLPGQSRMPHPAVGQAMRLLEGGLADRWTLSELAEELHLAPGSLVRLFKSATGVPPMAYLARLRAEHAAHLLLRTDQPIGSIARAVGWEDQNLFARRFRAHYGLSATTYRARFAATAEGHLPEGAPAAP
jgi:AraC family transcriptional regulator, L-rhamnose operon transcriptional activator RhaR